MPLVWFKVDGGFSRHPKVLQLGRSRVPCMGLWLTAGLESAASSWDGWIPRELVRNWDPKGRYSARLVTVGLWEETSRDGQPGYQFHDWHDYQPASSEVVRRHKARSEAGRIGGLKSARMRRAPPAGPQANA